MTSRRHAFLFGLIITVALVTYPFAGLYSVAFGCFVFAVWFGMELWRRGEINPSVMLLVALEVLLIWLAFAFAFYELTGDVSDSFAMSLQNLIQFNFINLRDEVQRNTIYRVLAAAEGFIGYLLIISGVAIAVAQKVRKSAPAT